MRATFLLLASVGAAVLLLGCPAKVGVTCRSHDDCKGLSNGYCARAEICTRECTSADPCEDGAACSDEGRRVCLPTCTDDAGCPTGFACQFHGDVQVCRLEHPLDPPSN
jgi:hypothetical protein